MAPRAPTAKPVPAPLIGGKEQGGLAGINNSVTQNAPPDGRLNMPTPWVGKVERGSIYEHMPEGPGKFHFQYNPNSLSYGFSINENLVDPSQTAQIPTAGALGGATLGFEILLNRQYEVAYEGDEYGVMRDLDVMRYIVGMKDPTYSYMIMKTVKFVLGKNIIFYGYINSLQAVVELFSEKMVPMFGKISIGAVQMPYDFNPNALKGTTSTEGGTAGAAAGAAPGAAAGTAGAAPAVTTPSKNPWVNAATGVR